MRYLGMSCHAHWRVLVFFEFQLAENVQLSVIGYTE